MDVAYVAHLARMILTESETKTFQGQLDHIVGYVEKIGEIDVSNVEPMSHVSVVQNVFRDDVVKEGLDRDVVMANAPVKVDNQFQVPKIVE